MIIRYLKIHRSVPAISLLLLLFSGCATQQGPIFRDGDRRALPVQRSQIAFDTTMGTFVIELFHNEAPRSVENFRQYVREGHYDNTLFHRVITDFVVQGGGFVRGEVALIEKPTRPTIVNEAYNGLRNERGRIAMARASGKDSAAAQFFINVSNNRELDHGVAGFGYCVFGQVVSGMDVVDRISQVETRETMRHPNLPVEDVVIQGVRILRIEDFVPRQ